MALREIQDQRGDAPTNKTRSNEYFVPNDGIDREVITADICRYLGKDALVRPGKREDPLTKEVKSGYYVTAYRNLTSAMIEDLQADSHRWSQEHRNAKSRTNVGYLQSRIHETRQQWGPSTELNLNYTRNIIPSPVYNQFSQATYPQSSPGVFSQSPHMAFMHPQDNYVTASNMAINQARGYPVPANVDVSRLSAPQYIQAPAGQQHLNQSQDQSHIRITHPEQDCDGPNFPPPLNMTRPYSYRDKKESNYTIDFPYGNYYMLCDSYNDQVYEDAGRYNQSSISPFAGVPQLNQIRFERIHANGTCDSRNYYNSGHQQ